MVDRVRLLVLVAAGAVLLGCRGSGEAELSDGSFPARNNSAIAVTDEGTFLFGGRLGTEGGLEPMDDAVLVDPVTGSRTGLPLAPYGIDEATAVSVGDTVVVTGIGCDDAVQVGQERECEPGGRASLVYDIGDGDWQEVDGPEGPNGALSAYTPGASAAAERRSVLRRLMLSRLMLRRLVLSRRWPSSWMLLRSGPSWLRAASSR